MEENRFGIISVGEEDDDSSTIDHFSRGAKGYISMMKYKIKIRASFDYDVEVEAKDETQAKAKASDSLMDYLDKGIQKTKEFDYFHEYLLKEEVLSIDVVV